jgi:hypothetical protein
VKRLALLALLLAACDPASEPAGAEDAGPRDLGPPVQLWDAHRAPDAAPVATEPECRAACERLAECADSLEAECPAVTEENRADAVVEPCVSACLGDANAALTVIATEACGELFARAREAIPPLAVACAPNGDPPECVRFGAGLARCVVDACAHAGPFSAGVAAWLRESCVANLLGGTPPSVFDEIFPPMGETACDDPTVADLVGQVSQGSIAALCLDGPVLSGDVCAAACRNVNRCAAPDTSLGDYDLCHFYCALLVDYEHNFRCASHNVGCDAMAACFN